MARLADRSAGQPPPYDFDRAWRWLRRFGHPGFTDGPLEPRLQAWQTGLDGLAGRYITPSERVGAALELAAGLGIGEAVEKWLARWMRPRHEREG